FIATLVGTGLTGVLTYLWPTPDGRWQQWTFLVHTVQGLCLTVLLALYLYLHYRRTLALRRPGIALAGILAAAISVAFVVSGLHIVLFGQTEARRAVYWTHVISGCGALVLLLGHVLLHRLTWPKHRPEPAPRLLSLSAVTVRWTAGHAVIAVAVILF